LIYKELDLSILYLQTLKRHQKTLLFFVVGGCCFAYFELALSGIISSCCQTLLNGPKQSSGQTAGEALEVSR